MARRAGLPVPVFAGASPRIEFVTVVTASADESPTVVFGPVKIAMPPDAVDAF